MNPEKIVELINKARTAMKLQPITVEEYQASLNADTKEAKRYRATQEAGRQFRLRRDLRNKYPGLKSGNPLARSLGYLFREEKTPEDAAYNSGLFEKCLTHEGSMEVIGDAIRQLSELPPSVFFPKDEAEMISNYEKYGGLMDFMFNMKLMVSDMASHDMTVSPAIKGYLDSHKGLFDYCGMQAAVIKLWSSPYYTSFGDPDELAVTGILMAAGANRADKSPEQVEFQLFGENSPTLGLFKSNEDVAKGGQALIASGQAKEMKYASGDLFEIAKTANAETVLDVPGKSKKAELDAEFDEKIVMNAQQRVMHDAQQSFNRNIFKSGSEYFYENADEKLVKLFGQKFEYDQANLDADVYTKDNFKLSDYKLPEGCPFTEQEAAVIGLSGMTLKGIGDISRQNLSIHNRAAGNYAFCNENMVYGTSRQGVGPLLHDSIEAARKNIPSVIKDYMAGNKAPLAETLSSFIKTAGLFINSSDNAGRGSCFEGRLLKTAMGMINRDPELGDIVKSHNLLSENDIKAAKLGEYLNDYYEARSEVLNRFKAELSAGREASAELKEELAAKMIAFDIIGDRKNRDGNEYLASPEFQTKMAEIMTDGDSTNRLARIDVLRRNAPISAFSETILQSEGFGALEDAIKNTPVVKRMANMNSRDFADALMIGTDAQRVVGKLSADIRKELNDMKSFTGEFDITGAKPEKAASAEEIAGDVGTLNRLSEGMADAQRNVHFGSDEFDTVARDIKLIEAAGRKLAENPDSLNEKSANIMKRSFEKLTADCKAYLDRKQRQGKLNADPESKTGKRIKMVRQAMEVSLLGQAKYEGIEKKILNGKELQGLQTDANKLLYDSLTPENAGNLIKNLNSIAGKNSDPEYGKKIVTQLNIVAKYMKDQKLDISACGLKPEDFRKSLELINAGGVGKKPEKQPEAKAPGAVR